MSSSVRSGSERAGSARPVNCGLERLSDLGVLRQIEQSARRQLRPLSNAEQRVVDASLVLGELPAEYLYQHSVLCQTFLPYRDPGDTERTWERTNGYVHLQLIAGEAWDNVRQQWVPLGIPFGPKARIVLMHINQLAVRTRSPLIELEVSLSAFVRRTLELDPNGRNMRLVKDQLRRVAGCSMRTGGGGKDEPARTTNPKSIVEKFELWSPKTPEQRTLAPVTLELNPQYWESLKIHAVPLLENHIAALSHSGMALDIYAWLAQRLHRIPPARPALVTWPLLHSQFGADVGLLTNFRRIFRIALKQVLTLYHDAKLDDDARGLTLRHSAPLVKPRLLAVSA